MTIKHSISKIQWAIVWALNYYIIELSSGCQSSCQQTSRELETRCSKKSHTRPMGLEALMNWGPEKMLIRCIKKACIQQWTPRPLVEHLREQERHNVTVITVRSKYEVYVRSPASSHMQTLSNPFQTLQIKWEVNIFVKKSSCVFLPASLSCVVYSCVCLWCCVVVMLNDDVDDYTTVQS